MKRFGSQPTGPTSPYLTRPPRSLEEVQAARDDQETGHKHGQGHEILDHAKRIDNHSFHWPS